MHVYPVGAGWPPVAGSGSGVRGTWGKAGIAQLPHLQTEQTLKFKMESRAMLRHRRVGTWVRPAGFLKHQQQQNAVSWGTVTRACSRYAPVATSPWAPACSISRHAKSRGNKVVDWHNFQSDTSHFHRSLFSFSFSPYTSHSRYTHSELNYSS